MHPTKEAISQGRFDSYIDEAARAVSYEEGFGLRGCDLSDPAYWVIYTRQSLEEQSQNNRLPDYLRTCAQEAKKLGVAVPREYVLYDAVTGEHLDRPNMNRLRQLMAARRIAGAIFPALDRLSREPLHQQIFELEAAHYRVRLHYADAPNGNDPGSQFARSILAHAAKLVKLSNRKNAVGGNIGRVLKGLAPAHRAAYGYRYRREGEVGANGRLCVTRAWWEIDSMGPDGKIVLRSPAWVVVRIFTLIGDEGRTLHWVSNTLNEMGIKSAEGRRWSPGKVAKIVHRQCYSGTHVYNMNARESNPNKPLEDFTGEIKRTLVRPKPKEEWVNFQVPPLVDRDLYQKAIVSVTERGRGRGKQGKTIQALLRGRLHCPRCGKAMVVRRDGRDKRIYYHCSKYFQPWRDNPCDYRKFIPGTWDDLIWGDICQWLRNDEWVERQLASEQAQGYNTEKMVRLQQFKIAQARAKIDKIREGFEAGIYTLEEAKKRIAEQEKAASKAEAETQRLRERSGTRSASAMELEVLREELRALRDRNLDEATFEDKMEIIARLGIVVYPAEDLKSMRVVCQVNLQGAETEKGGHASVRQSSAGTLNSEAEQSGGLNTSQPNGVCGSTTGCGKIPFAPPFRTIGKTHSKSFPLDY